MSREQPARNRWDIEIFWEIRRKVQKNEGVDCAIGGLTGTFCKDRAGHALLSDCSTNERSAFIAVPLPFRGDEDRIGGSAIWPPPFPRRPAIGVYAACLGESRAGEARDRRLLALGRGGGGPAHRVGRLAPEYFSGNLAIQREIRRGGILKSRFGGRTKFTWF